MLIIGPNQYGIFRLMLILTLGSKKILISDIDL